MAVPEAVCVALGWGVWLALGESAAVRVALDVTKGLAGVHV